VVGPRTRVEPTNGFPLTDGMNVLSLWTDMNPFIYLFISVVLSNILPFTCKAVHMVQIAVALQSNCEQGRPFPPKPMMHVAYSLYFCKIYKFPPIYNKFIHFPQLFLQNLCFFA